MLNSYQPDINIHLASTTSTSVSVIKIVLFGKLHLYQIVIKRFIRR